ncbi:hypothetical protein Acr_23g0011510 [Actinidia rufa]|uniref:F-box domain-containing protein n=1 Tax=Actinidia rufa TaxID=165716 RepID=A0A7J0GPM2_9ERIC|nr:hypothetical protein Acr_23g0011510 [Actinidia rufa]
MGISSDPPDDVITNILSRLPVKSLMQFRFVVKSWRNLIRDPHFINMHISQASENKIGFLILKHQSDSGDEGYYSLHSDGTFAEHARLESPFGESERNFEILGSCNGLLLLSPEESTFDHGMSFWNPSIRKIKRIPNSYATSALSDSCSHVVLGFGVLPQINDYRVVRILYHEKFNPLSSPKVPPVVEIYLLRTDSWRRIEVVISDFIINTVSKAFVNRCIHWVATRTRENQHDDFIMSFDMVSEVFREIKLPNCSLDDGALTGSLAVFRESLCLFARGSEAGNEVWETWVLKEEYGSVGSWSKQFIIDNNQGFSWPLGFMKHGEVLLGTIEGELSLYDPKILQVKKLNSNVDPDMLDIFPFMESLVLLDDGNNLIG